MRYLQRGVILAALAAILVQAEGKFAHAQVSPPSPVLVSTIEQQSREPLIINYQNGELSILASNARLSDILRAVSNRTGAVIPIPREATERVNIQIGPGPVINVLGALLNETSFDYLIQELSADQIPLVRVALSLKGKGPHTPQKFENPVLSVAEANPRAAEQQEAWQQGVSDRNRLIQEILDDRQRIMEQSPKDNEDK